MTFLLIVYSIADCYTIFVILSTGDVVSVRNVRHFDFLFTSMRIWLYEHVVL